MIFNKRQQRAVGQGLFHTASIGDDEHQPFTFVYDCGSMSTYAAARDQRIGEYRISAHAPSRLDILFISHIHADHVNGLPLLLADLLVDTIVLPLINPDDRLISLARALSVDAESAEDSFFQNLVIDPAAALSRFKPRRIIFVRRGGDDGAPGSAALTGRATDAPTSIRETIPTRS